MVSVVEDLGMDIVLDYSNLLESSSRNNNSKSGGGGCE
jgi:hypothetical protein